MRLIQWWKRAAFGLGLPVFLWTTSSLAQTANAQDWQLREITAEVPGHPGTSYSDLLKQVIPDLEINENSTTGHLMEPLRHIAADYGGELPASIAIGSLQVSTFMMDGRMRTAILTDLGTVETTVEQPTLLAVFDDGRIPKFLDAVDVGMDRDTSYGVPALVNIGPGNQALVTRSNHFNSNETFETTAMIILHGSRLKLVDTFSTYGVRTCNEETRQVLTLEERPVGNANTYSDILATIEENQTLTGETCDGEIPRNRFSTAHRPFIAGIQRRAISLPFQMRWKSFSSAQRSK
ncbi:hypothetical protein LP421_02585 (plasmid) [Rhizobium sp. RCAM05350]|nr:hypothetical protein LP421_02585 [Rhizobium sp. RCAM05350]